MNSVVFFGSAVSSTSKTGYKNESESDAHSMYSFDKKKLLTGDVHKIEKKLPYNTTEYNDMSI